MNALLTITVPTDRLDAIRASAAARGLSVVVLHDRAAETDICLVPGLTEHISLHAEMTGDLTVTRNA